MMGQSISLWHIHILVNTEEERVNFSPKYLPLKHLKTHPTWISYSPCKKKKKKSLVLSVYPYTIFPGTHPLWLILTPLFWDHSVLVTFTQCGVRPHMVVQECRADQSSQHTDATGWWQSQERAQFCWFPSTWGRWRDTSKPAREGTSLCNMQIVAWNLSCGYHPWGLPWTTHLHKSQHAHRYRIQIWATRCAISQSNR